MDREPEDLPLGFPYDLIVAGLFVLVLGQSCGWWGLSS
jgi:hypothetical protein